MSWFHVEERLYISIEILIYNTNTINKESHIYIICIYFDGKTVFFLFLIHRMEPPSKMATSKTINLTETNRMGITIETTRIICPKQATACETMQRTTTLQKTRILLVFDRLLFRENMYITMLWIQMYCSC